MINSEPVSNYRQLLAAIVLEALVQYKKDMVMGRDPQHTRTRQWIAGMNEVFVLCAEGHNASTVEEFQRKLFNVLEQIEENPRIHLRDLAEMNSIED